MSYKQIYDPIHKFITLTPLMTQIIDTYEFQRLRDLKQLGATYLVFPSASHNRFEHSIGVSHLAGIMMDELYLKQPELKITDRLIELVRIAALIHDIGHGPFSHLYDHYVKDEAEYEHEYRGLDIFKNMVKKYNLELSKKEIEIICNIIDPPSHLQDHWLYQIVNNKINHIDVDKIDYILRDSYHIGLFHNDFSRILTMVKVLYYNNSLVLAWHEKIQHDIYLLFSCRYRLHKQIYNHRTVKAFEYLLIPIMKKIKNTGIDFIHFTDSTIMNQHKELEAIYERKLPIMINEDIKINPTRPTIDYEKINNEKVVLDYVTISLASNCSDPLSKVYYFNNKTNSAFTINSSKNSFIIPTKQSETIIRLYVKNEDYTEEAQSIWLGLKT
tara:strand:- start:5117 stop:6271 length:1155 start_codon:yes stop_codon:yes gene_type:complete